MSRDIDEEWKKYARHLDDNRNQFPSDAAFCEFLAAQRSEYQVMRSTLKAEKAPMATTPAELDAMLLDGLTEAIKQTHEQIKRRYAEGVHPSPNERVGMFTTNLRRTLTKMADVSKEVQKFCADLIRTNVWSDIGIMGGGGIYSVFRPHITYETGKGVWKIEERNIVQFAERATMSASWVPSAKQLDHTIAAGLNALASDIKGFDLKIKEAEMINGEADKVTASLTAIAESLVEAA